MWCGTLLRWDPLFNSLYCLVCHCLWISLIVVTATTQCMDNEPHNNAWTVTTQSTDNDPLIFLNQWLQWISFFAVSPLYFLSLDGVLTLAFLWQMFPRNCNYTPDRKIWVYSLQMQMIKKLGVSSDHLKIKVFYYHWIEKWQRWSYFLLFTVR